MRVRTSNGFLALVVIIMLSSCLTPEEDSTPTEGNVQLLALARNLSGQPLDQVATVTDTTTTAVPLDTQAVRRVAEDARPAVVSIFVKTRVPYRVSLLPIRLPFTSFRVRLPGRGLGSGFFIHPSGYVLTNDHVIRGAEEIYGLTWDRQELELAVVARDPVIDLALLEVRAPRRSFTPLPLGNADEVAAGDFVVTVGNPLGLGHTVTFGIVSATDRNLSGVADTDRRHIDFLQIDSAINPGSSGGPLITLAGACIGVNTAGIAQAQNIGFAVPATQVLEFLDDVLAGRGDLVP